jgi:hypothetical protein
MKTKTRYSAFATALAATMAASPSNAIQFDGFITVGAASHDDKNENTYIGSLGDRGITNDITFETDTRFGLQISSDIADNASVVAQILATGVDANFNAVVEWAYVDYEFSKYISLRAGKIKQPVYLVNDYVEVGFAYPWIRPPVEVYYLNNPLNTVNGAELLISFPIGKGQLSFQPYIGSNRDDIPNTGGNAFFEAEGIAGIDVKYAAPGYLVHASSFHCREVNTFGNLTDMPTAFGFPVDVNLNGTGKCDVTSAGLNLDLANFVMYAEWQERKTSDTLARPFGDTEAWYTTFGYRFGKWLPHITFASIEGKSSSVNPGAVSCAASTGTGGCNTPLGNVPGGTPLFNFPVPIQTSITAGLRYEVNDSAALKIEYSMVDVETDPAEIAKSNNPFNINFGLFDTSFTGASPTEKVGITSIALDVIF